MTSGAFESVYETASSSSANADLSTSSSSIEANRLPSSQSNAFQTHDASVSTAVSQDPIISTSPASLSSASVAPSSNQTGVIVGGVIGGVAVLALLSGIIAWTWIQHTRRNSQNHGTLQAAWTNQNDPQESVVPENNEIYEVDALRSVGELEFRPIMELGHSTTPR